MRCTPEPNKDRAAGCITWRCDKGERNRGPTRQGNGFANSPTMKQTELFPPSLPDGLRYRPDFIPVEEEHTLLAAFERLPFEEAQYKQFTARRRTVSYGSTYDFSANQSRPAPPIPEFLLPLRERVAAWCGIPAEGFVHALVSEYRPGTPLGWHRDVPEFEVIVGISLLSGARMRFRPYPWSPERRRAAFSLELEPRSAYVIRDAARWRWQHSVPAVKQLRYSITLRTRREGTDEHVPR